MAYNKLQTIMMNSFLGTVMCLYYCLAVQSQYRARMKKRAYNEKSLSDEHRIKVIISVYKLVINNEPLLKALHRK